MITFLKGHNFSGRSNWMKDRRKKISYPKVALISHTVDTAYTGLAWTVREELKLVSEREDSKYNDVIEQFGLQDFLDRELHVLSGGESVRTALGAAVLLSPDEIQIDGALEQLDNTWRARIFDFLNEHSARKSIIVADNHITDEFTGQISFPLAVNEHQIKSNFSVADALKYISHANSLRISIENLSFRYPKSREIFKNIGNHFEPSNLYFFVGANGSGKTTLVKLLSGALIPQHGSISYGVNKFNPSRSPLRYTALAFQHPDYQWTSNSVRREISRLSKIDQVGQIDFLESFGIDRSFLGINPIELPFVIKKRLGIALAVLAGKQWLILDEPTLGQDESYRNSLADFIKSALEMQIGVLVISHDASFRALFPRAKKVVFENGSISTD